MRKLCAKCETYAQRSFRPVQNQVQHESRGLQMGSKWAGGSKKVEKIQKMRKSEKIWKKNRTNLEKNRKNLEKL